MQQAIISSSELTKNGRMDAGFHLLNTEYADRAAALAVQMSEADVITLLSDEQAMPTNVLKFLEPLTRGNKPANRELLLKAVKEYPYLSMAVVQDKGGDILEAKQKELTQQAVKVSAAQTTLATNVATIQGTVPIALKEKQLLNKNNFVAGVVYFDGDILSIPVETCPTAYVADCWVIERAEWTGPGMINELVSSGNVPVPRRQQDLGNPVGFVASLADHTQNYGQGWGSRDDAPRG
jgi:hypothetical protein